MRTLFISLAVLLLGTLLLPDCGGGGGNGNFFPPGGGGVNIGPGSGPGSGSGSGGGALTGTAFTGTAFTGSTSTLTSVNTGTMTSTGTSSGSATWPCPVQILQAGQVTIDTTGNGTPGICGLGPPNTQLGQASCPVTPPGGSMTTGWCEANGTASTMTVTGMASTGTMSTSTPLTCNPTTTTAPASIVLTPQTGGAPVTCITLAVGQTLKYIVSEPNYTGMFTVLVTDGKIATAAPVPSANDTYAFSGLAAGSTTATITDTISNSVNIQIVVQPSSSVIAPVVLPSF